MASIVVVVFQVGLRFFLDCDKMVHVHVVVVALRLIISLMLRHNNIHVVHVECINVVNIQVR